MELQVTETKKDDIEKIKNVFTNGFNNDYIWENVKMVGSGNFGCVLKIQIKQESRDKYYQNEFVAIKLQIIKLNNDPNGNNQKLSNSDRLFNEHNATKWASDSRKNYHTFNLPLLFGVYYIPITIKNQHVFNVLSQCGHIRDQITKIMKSNEDANLQVMEMEFVGVSLKNFLQVTWKVGLSINLEDIKWVTIQMLIALYCLTKDHFISHRDLKPANIVIQPRDHAKLKFCIQKDKWILPQRLQANDKFKLLNDFAYLIDFGISVSWGNWTPKCEPFFYTSAPVKLLLEESKDYNDLSGDLWSVGALMIHMALCGWKPPFIKNIYEIDFPAKVFMEYQPFNDNCVALLSSGYPQSFQKPGYFSKRKSSDDYEYQDPNISDANSFDEEKWKAKMSRMLFLISTCLLNNSLFGEYLPQNPPKNTQFGFGYKILNENKLAFMGYSTIGNTNIFDIVAKEIKEKLGIKGMNLLSFCMKWTDEERFAQFGIERSPQNIHKIIHKIMKLEFFREYLEGSNAERVYGYNT